MAGPEAPGNEDLLWTLNAMLVIIFYCTILYVLLIITIVVMIAISVIITISYYN